MPTASSMKHVSTFSLNTWLGSFPPKSWFVHW